MIKTVLIDIDNTLLDFDAYVQEAMKYGFKKFNLGSYEDYMFQVFEQLNNGMWREIEQGIMTYEELLQKRWNRIFSELDISFDGTEFEKYFRRYLFDSAIPVKGAEDILAYLKDRYILCVASNGPYEQQLNRLRKGQMFSYFSEFFISEKIGASKPSEKFFSYCLNKLNNERVRQKESEILPSEVIMIGDSLTSDIAGATASGFKTCFFDRKKNGKTNNLNIDHIISELADIKSFL